MLATHAIVGRGCPQIGRGSVDRLHEDTLYPQIRPQTVDTKHTQLVRTNQLELWIVHVLNGLVGATCLTDASVLEVPCRL